MFAARPLTVLLVAAVDLRFRTGLALLPQFEGCDERALHISLDRDQTCALAQRWMDLGIASLPLQIEEPGGDLVHSVRVAVEREARIRPRVTVIIPEIALGRWWQPLLHRGRARALAWELAGVDGVTTVIVPVRLDLPGRAELTSAGPA